MSPHPLASFEIPERYQNELYLMVFIQEIIYLK